MPYEPPNWYLTKTHPVDQRQEYCDYIPCFEVNSLKIGVGKASWSMEASEEVLVSDACVSLVMPAVAKSNQDRNFITASITTLSRIQVHRRVTSALITQLRMYSFSCWVHREICPYKEFSTLFTHTGNWTRNILYVRQECLLLYHLSKACKDLLL